MNARELSSSIVRAVDRILASRLRGLLPEEKRYWLLVPVTGVASGLLAVLLVHLLNWIELLAWGVSSDVRSAAGSASAAKRFLVPTVAGGLIALALFLIRRRERSPPREGTSGLIEALAVGAGRIPLLSTVATGIVSIAAVGAGASLGREGALIGSGAACGSWFGRTFRLRDHHVKALLACGAAGGMAASYNVPIGASVFAMEVLLGTLALDLFGPIIICAVISTAIARALLGGATAYTIPAPLLETYTLVSEWEIPLYLLLGAVLGAVSAAMIRVFSGLDDLFRWLRPLGTSRAIVAMTVLGFVGLFAPDLFRELIGNGYDTVNEVLAGRFVGDSLTWPLARTLLLILVLKLGLTALCRAARIPGGLFTPSLFVGALLGVTFGAVLHAWLPEQTAPAEGYALVAMGAMIAGTMQAPITSILMIFEMTRSYSIILPLMTACIASAVISRLIVRTSLFTEPLRRRGIHLPHISSPIWFKEPPITDFLRKDVDRVAAAAPFETVVDTFLRTPKEHDRLYVVDAEDRFLGAVSLHEIKAFIRESEHLETVIAADIMNPHFPVVYAGDSISSAVDLLAGSSAERLPVLEDATSRKLVGSVSKSDLLSSYRDTSLTRVENE